MTIYMIAKIPKKLNLASEDRSFKRTIGISKIFIPITYPYFILSALVANQTGSAPKFSKIVGKKFVTIKNYINE